MYYCNSPTYSLLWQAIICNAALSVYLAEETDMYKNGKQNFCALKHN